MAVGLWMQAMTLYMLRWYYTLYVCSYVTNFCFDSFDHSFFLLFYWVNTATTIQIQSKFVALKLKFTIFSSFFPHLQMDSPKNEKNKNVSLNQDKWIQIKIEYQKIKKYLITVEWHFSPGTNSKHYLNLY